MKEKTAIENLVSLITKDIYERKYFPGVHLTEMSVSVRYGVSRSTAREAFIILISEGIVERIPNKGVFIRKLSSEQLRDIHEYLGKLEIMMIELIFESVNNQTYSELKKQILNVIDKLDNDINFDLIEFNNNFILQLAQLTKNQEIIKQIKYYYTILTLHFHFIGQRRRNISNGLLMDYFKLIDNLEKGDLENGLLIISSKFERAVKYFEEQIIQDDYL